MTIRQNIEQHMVTLRVAGLIPENADFKYVTCSLSAPDGIFDYEVKRVETKKGRHGRVINLLHTDHGTAAWLALDMHVTWRNN